MAKFIDLSNQKIGEITILERTTPPGVPIKWRCKCFCGNEFEARGNDIKNGKTKSCGCLRKKITREKNLIDISNQTFGRLTVIENSHGNYWKCKCECGNICEVLGPSLRSGNTKSCGCLHKESFSNASNLIGKRFGKLLVIEKTSKRIHSNIVWKCQCDCGNIKEVYTNLLTQGKVKSCGCLISLGEEKIKQLLIENNIPFEQQKIFKTCKFPDTNKYAKFDFYVDNKYLIEFDGKQHFNKGGWGESYESIKYRDDYKNQWCKENGILLIRIPYYDIDKINLDMITI